MASHDKPTPEIVWTPDEALVGSAALTDFARRVGHPDSYQDLWQWSVDDLEGFWQAVVDHFGVRFHAQPRSVLESRAMPGTRWFPGATLNYAEHLFAGKDPDELAIQHVSELRELDAWPWRTLREETARIRAGLLARGIGEGDVVAAYLPNIPETVAAFLATASIGAVWASAAPEFGARAVVDRFAQIEPALLLAVDGYRYGGKDFDRTGVVASISAEVGAPVIRLGYLDGTGWEPGFLGERDAPLDFVPVDFQHPLFVLSSSGTTGLPKAIVHGHGGILIEQLKYQHLHLDARRGDRVFWFTTTGWMMWNFLVGVLSTEASIILYDGNPATPSYERLWDLAAETGMTTFGTSPAYLTSCEKAGVEPATGRNLASLRTIGVTGAPLAPEAYTWVRDHLGADVWLCATSGGTDVCTALVGGIPTLPVYRGEMQGPALGVSVAAYDDAGHAVVDRVGELVVTEPMPSMPVAFWNDPAGSRMRETYFDRFPAVWRHGDWVEITTRHTTIISGRSDSTINRGGVRIGTGEIYRAVLVDEAVVDALVVDVPREGAENWMALFVALREGESLSPEVASRIRQRIRRDCSPRHVPDDVLQVPRIPRTLSGKLVEVPVKRILMGVPPDRAVSRESLADPAALDSFVGMTPPR